MFQKFKLLFSFCYFFVSINVALSGVVLGQNASSIHVINQHDRLVTGLRFSIGLGLHCFNSQPTHEEKCCYSNIIGIQTVVTA